MSYLINFLKKFVNFFKNIIRDGQRDRFLSVSISTQPDSKFNLIIYFFIFK